MTGADVGNTTSAQSLLDEFDTVVLCCGASNPRNLTGPGRDECQGIYFAVDFLKANTKSLLDSNLDRRQVHLLPRTKTWSLWAAATPATTVSVPPSATAARASPPSR